MGLKRHHITTACERKACECAHVTSKVQPSPRILQTKAKLPDLVVTLLEHLSEGTLITGTTADPELDSLLCSTEQIFHALANSLMPVPSFFRREASPTQGARECACPAITPCW